MALVLRWGTPSPWEKMFEEEQERVRGANAMTKFQRFLPSLL